MCGIAGVLYADPHRPVDLPTLRRMADALVHRGPDAAGVWSARGVGLAHRRLSIVDVAGGAQPMTDASAGATVVFNGEIYNFRELRAELEGRGHRFHSQSDTEVLLHLYRERGEELVGRLRGMFAFALWDGARQRLCLARDRVGIKPLYLYRDQEKAVFASELKAILVHPDVPAQIDPEALEEYLTFGMISGRRAIFRRFEKLAAAHRVVLSRDHLGRAPERYWRLSFEPDHRRTPAQWQEEVAAKIDEAVRIHLVADVPVGAFLSGGVDSSLIVARAARAGTSTPLQTFSMGFDERGYSELPYARLVAEAYGTRHREAVVSADAAALVDTLAYHFDEPFGDASAVPTYLVSRLASEHVKVALSGDGGDEAFGGYPRYAGHLREASIRRWVPSVVRRRLTAPMGGVRPHEPLLTGPTRLQTLFTSIALDPAAAYANSVAVARGSLGRALLAPDVRAMLNGHDAGGQIVDAFAAASRHGLLNGMIAADVAVRLPDDYLVKVDRASMAHGLEVRPPFLDHELLELTARMPASLKVRGRTTKWLLKEIARSHISAAVVDRPKRGFEVPVNGWFRGPLVGLFESSVLDNGLRIAELVDTRAVRQLFADHRAGRASHGNLLWSLLMLGRWAERFLAARPVAVGSAA